MRRALILCLCLFPAVSGCIVCSGIDDYNYAAYGGIWPRTNMSQGRVGSAFGTPAELPVESEWEVVPPESSLESGAELLPAPEPLSPLDEVQ